MLIATPVIVILLRLFKPEQLVDIVFCQEGADQYSHNFIDAPVKVQLSCENFNCTICVDCESIISMRDESFFATCIFSWACEYKPKNNINKAETTADSIIKPEFINEEQ